MIEIGVAPGLRDVSTPSRSTVSSGTLRRTTVFFVADHAVRAAHRRLSRTSAQVRMPQSETRSNPLAKVEIRVQEVG